MLEHKKLFVSTVIIVFSLLFFVRLTHAEGNKIGIVNADILNVRQSPSLTSQVIDQLSNGSQVKVVESSGDWYGIRYGEKTGWVFGEFLIVKELPIGTGTINANNVNIRETPGLTSRVLTMLNRGHRLDFFEKTGDWYRVRLGDGSFGWVFMDLFTTIEATSSRGGAPSNTDSVAEIDGYISEMENGDDILAYLANLVEYAKQFLGVKYVYGGSTPQGFDCSGFIQYVYKHFGISIERVAANQAKNGVFIDKSELRIGDAVFFDTNGTGKYINHTGIYIGNGQFIHASSGRNAGKVVISDLTQGFYANCYMTSRRYMY